MPARRWTRQPRFRRSGAKLHHGCRVPGRGMRSSSTDAVLRLSQVSRAGPCPASSDTEAKRSAGHLTVDIGAAHPWPPVCGSVTQSPPAGSCQDAAHRLPGRRRGEADIDAIMELPRVVLVGSDILERYPHGDDVSGNRHPPYAGQLSAGPARRRRCVE